MTPGGEDKKFSDPQIFYNLWDEGLSVSAIANQLNCTRKTVQLNLSNYKNYTITESKHRGGKKAHETLTETNSTLSSNKINQYDLKGNFIRSWESCKQIERELKIDACCVGRAISGKQKTAGGYQWCREGTEANLELGRVWRKRKVEQYDLNDNYITSYETIKSAAEAMKCDPSNISDVLRGKGNRKTACGYKWKYKE